jgi:hypothetical protein
MKSASAFIPGPKTNKSSTNPTSNMFRSWDPSWKNLLPQYVSSIVFYFDCLFIVFVCIAIFKSRPCWKFYSTDWLRIGHDAIWLRRRGVYYLVPYLLLLSFQRHCSAMVSCVDVQWRDQISRGKQFCHYVWCLLHNCLSPIFCLFCMFVTHVRMTPFLFFRCMLNWLGITTKSVHWTLC